MAKLTSQVTVSNYSVSIPAFPQFQPLSLDPNFLENPNQLINFQESSNPSIFATSPTKSSYFSLVKSPQQMADPINQNFQERYQKFIPNDEYSTLSPFETTKIITDDLKANQAEEQIASILAVNPSTPIDTHPPSLINNLPVTTLVLLGLGGISYGIMRQYSHNPQWHLTLIEKLQKLMGKSKQMITENVIFLHDEAIQELKEITRHAVRLENKCFDQQDFIYLTSLHHQLNQEKGEYEGIAQSVKQFKAAIAVKQQQEIIEHIEMSHQGYIQSHFYQYFADLLEETTDIKLIRLSLYQKFTELLPEVKTDQGKNSLKSYLKAVDQLLEQPNQPFSLSLYKALKNSETLEYQSLKEVTEILSDLPDSEISNLKTLTCFVIANDDIFQQIGKLINLPRKYHNPQNYAKILQYQVMSDRYQASLAKFDQLLDVLKQWYQPYQVIIGIRQEYPQSDYQQPPSFQEKIPGLSLYLKYKNRLCDQTTGISYLDFEEEMQAVMA